MPLSFTTHNPGEQITAADINAIQTGLVGVEYNPASIQAGPFGSRPAANAATAGRLYFSTDIGVVSRDNGGAWENISGNSDGGLFTSPPGSGWTTTTLGSATIGADKDGRLLTVPAVAGDNWRVEYRTPAATSNYTLTAYLDHGFLNQASCFAGICLRSSGGAYVTFGPATASGMKLALLKWNSATSYNADYIRWDIANLLGRLPNWYRFRDDGTTRFAEISFNGVDWITVHSVGRTDFLTMSQIGWGADFNTSGVTNTLRLRSWKES